MNITTNNVPRYLMALAELPEKAKKDFDYVGDDDSWDERFFQYRGAWYDVNEFQRIQVRGTAGFNPHAYTAEPDSALAKWHAIQTDSYFSGVVVKLVNNGESVVVGSVYA